MPPFNPNVPDVNPTNSAFWARPIEQPRPDVSKETLYKGLGKGFDEAVTGVDDFIKHGVIRPIEQQDLGTHRDEFADALNSAREYIGQGLGYTSGDKPSLMKSGENVPQAVAGVSDRVQTLHDSMLGGHLSESKYYADINNYLRRLRSMFPGYVDFIDQEAYRITGVHAANADIRSNIADLNRLMSEHQGRKDEVTQFLDWASKEGALPPDVYQDFQNRYRANPGDTGLLDEMRSYVNKARQYKTNNAIAEGEYKRHEEDKRVADEKAKIGLNQAYTQEREQFIDHTEIASGLFKGYNMRAFLQGLADGTIDTNDPQFSAGVAIAAQQYRAKIDQLKSGFTNYAMKAYPGYSGAGDGSVENIIKTNLQPLEDNYKHLTEGEYSWFTVNANMSKGLKADAELSFEKKYQQWRGAMEFIKETGATNFITPKMFPDIQGKVEEVYKFDMAKAVAQPDLRPGGSGEVFTLDKALQDWKAKGATKENYDQLMGWRDLMLDKQTPAAMKENLAKFFYSVDNWQNFRKYNFAEPGEIYTRLFNEAVSKNLAKLSTESYQLYRGAAEAEGGTLFGRDMESVKGFERGGAGDAKFIWHSEPTMMRNGQMGFLEATGVRVPSSLQSAINNLNRSFMGIKSVYDHDPNQKGTPVEQYVAQMMMEHGINPGDTGLPNKIFNAVMASRSKPSMTTPGEESGKVKTLEEK